MTRLETDLDEIVEAAEGDLRQFCGARLYITGGTGFFGTWLLRTIACANRRLGTAISADVLTRDPDAFCRNAPDVATHDAIQLARGDVLTPKIDGIYDGLIHAATPASAALNEQAPETMLRTIIDGARAVIEGVLVPSGAVPALFTSSGAVYGRQPPELDRVPETYAGAPDPLEPRSAYHEGKRLAELLFALAARRGAGIAKIARLFAFLGPGLPLNVHFAAGNFIRDALTGVPVAIGGDGTPLRSYLYPTDMIIWSLAVFARGEAGRAYNVGSSVPVSIRALAEKIGAAADPPVTVSVAAAVERGRVPDRYVPDTTRIEQELNVAAGVSLDEAIERTFAFYRESREKMSSVSM